MKRNKIAKWKTEKVKDLENKIKNYKVIAIADLTSLPSLQLQKMRSKLKATTDIIGSKSSLMKIALTNLKDKIKGIEELNKYFQGVASLVLTNESAFMLSKKLSESKTSAPAKPGQVAPREIKIPAGPTPFPPGPIIGELGKIGLKTGVEGGKVAVKEEKIVAKKGDIISKDVAAVLSKLKIEPMELGINLVAAYEEGVIFTSDILLFDENEYKKKIENAALDSFKLTLALYYPTKENISILLVKAYRDSIFLADSKDIMTSENIKKLLGKAEAQAEALKEQVNVE
jgi:large subunit ribosomal protein L10